MKNILIGVTSGIACYKALDVCSNLKKMGYNVTVMMSENTTKLISPDLFKIITGNDVYSNNFENKNNKVDHIELIKNNDLYAIIPATFNFIGKLSNGIADDFISTCISAANPKRVVIFPAMNTRMFNNYILKDNLNKLLNYGYNIINPIEGNLACGEFGIGKLLPINEIVEIIDFYANFENKYKDKNILITAGGTREFIDPVRYISNLSSGKMGYSLAKQAAILGANVTLITTKTDINIPYNMKKVIYVENAEEMYKEVLNEYDNNEYIFKVAAVSDFKVKKYSNNKIKKSNFNYKIDLVENVDILKQLSKIENRKFKLIGFAAESENLKENALKKLCSKNLDYIILNDISKKNIGFNSDYNKVIIFDKNKNELEIDYDTKENISKKILEYILL